MILVISENKITASAVCDMLYFMGILSHPATPEEALSEISPRYSAAVVLTPSSIENEEELILLLRSVEEKIPIFAHGTTELSELYDGAFPIEYQFSEVVFAIKAYAEKKGIPAPQDYLSKDAAKDFREFFSAVSGAFTRTEEMIINALLKSAPEPLSKEDVLKFAFRQGRLPEISGIRTHVSIINKKCIKMSGRKLISATDNGGYVFDFSENSAPIQKA